MINKVMLSEKIYYLESIAIILSKPVLIEQTNYQTLKF